MDLGLLGLFLVHMIMGSGGGNRLSGLLPAKVLNFEDDRVPFLVL